MKMEKFDLCVIGAGPSGYAAAMRAVDFKKKVLLIEKDRDYGNIYSSVYFPKNTMNDWSIYQLSYKINKHQYLTVYRYCSNIGKNIITNLNTAFIKLTVVQINTLKKHKFDIYKIMKLRIYNKNDHTISEVKLLYDFSKDQQKVYIDTGDINIKWEGEGENEIGVNLNNNKKVVKVNPDFFRPCEVELLIGDASKAKSELSWDPVTSLEDLCSIMVQADLERNKSDVK